MDLALDSHARPPVQLQEIYKRLRKAKRAEIQLSEDIFDLERGHTAGFRQTAQAEYDLALPTEIHQILASFLGEAMLDHPSVSYPPQYEHPDIPGLYIIPSLLPPLVQLRLLDRLLHRDLSSSSHDNNVKLHYHVPYRENTASQSPSFFDQHQAHTAFEPKDTSIHKPITTEAFLNKKLRWMTLGGQYDWTRKVYPSSVPPPFPRDIADLIQGLFPAMKAQAAIVNLYSPGDTLSLHRDVSEECNRPLVSVSFGCDAIFVVGNETEDGTKAVSIRLKSGDVAIMSGEARTAWHSVPLVVAGTCPDWMASWPGKDDEEGHVSAAARYEHWRGWMAGKRINLNVRQMYDDRKVSSPSVSDA